MNYMGQKQMVCCILLIIPLFIVKELSAGTAAQVYDYSHRKRDCEITVVSSAGEPQFGALIGITQIDNDFGFGGTIRGEEFDSLGDVYGEHFRSYFDVATPENEMTWEYGMRGSQKGDPDFSKADTLINWLLAHKIPVRGHHLFSNEKDSLIPEWARNLEPAAFKEAMQERITTAMGHFKGKVSQWDLISEIYHGDNGSITSAGMLQTKSGDPDIFSWIMDEARKNDPDADFVLNDYNLITANDLAAADQFIAIVKPLSSKFTIIGAGGHFGTTMDKSSYGPKIDYLAEQLGKPVWLSEVDFSFDITQAPDKIEELMRTCFANPNVGGLTMGTWCSNGSLHRNLTSYFVDSLNNETAAGERWREVRSGWNTEVSGYTDEAGKFTFNGFQGKYMIVISCFTDTFYVEPGEGTKTITVAYLSDTTAVAHTLTGHKTTPIIINGRALPVTLPVRCNQPLFLATYSLSGQRLSRSPVNLTGNNRRVAQVSSCCRVFQIETADRRPLYTGKITAIRSLSDCSIAGR